MKEQHIVIATDSFKGSASSKEAEAWLEIGIRRVLPACRISKFPIADGGEGTVDALVSVLGGQLQETSVQNPLGESVTAQYGLLENNVAVIEMAESSGITLIDQTPENALQASTYGVGELILAAIEDGAKEIYLGIGGSATSDGGVGMAQALGVSFLDQQGKEVPRGLAGLPAIATIDATKLDPRLAAVKINVLSDVTNPLVGPEGAIAVYGPQKGLPSEQIEELDRWMQHYAAVLTETTGIAIAEAAGAGAAGGLGAGLQAFCQTETYQGIDKILSLLNIEEQMKTATLVITGEGKMDTQSMNGKAPIGIAKLAKKYQKPVIAVVGGRDNNLTPIYEAGIDLVLSIVNRPMTLAEAIAQVEEHMIAAGETAIRAFLLNKS